MADAPTPPETNPDSTPPEKSELPQFLHLHETLRTIIWRFNGQRVAKSLFDHNDFILRYGQKTYEGIIAGLDAEPERIKLPFIMHVRESYPGPIQVVEAGAWSFLFLNGREHRLEPHPEVLWVIALALGTRAVSEADVSLCEELFSGFSVGPVDIEAPPRVWRWAISRMGFIPEGAAALAARGYATSDYLQIELLRTSLENDNSG